MTDNSWLNTVIRQQVKGDYTEQSMPANPNQAWKQAAKQCHLDETAFTQRVADAFGLPVSDFGQAKNTMSRYIPHKLAKERLIAPLDLEDNGTLVVAVSNPGDENTLQQAKFASGRPIKCTIASPSQIEQHINQLYLADVGEDLKSHIRLKEDGSPLSDSEMQHHPVVIFARKLLYQAYTLGASDLHIQPYMGGGQIRFRIDGVLRRSTSITSEVMLRVIRYFMVMGDMDTSHAMTPQDGAGTLFVGNRRIDLRISTLPNRGGNRLVIRLLDQGRVFSMDSMYFPPHELHVLRRMTSFSQGMILFTGPTGSGKTTSLYGLLSSLNDEGTNIITLENPVEYELSGISQVDIDPERGLTFENSLRAVLRQDPDIVLVGEIRDEQTATIATRAAPTGHLLFSTLHTMDARNSISRLLDLGISQPVLGETLLGVVAQRLVRKLCDHCAVPVEEPLNEIESLFAQINQGVPPARRPVGCEHCSYTGYKGRTAVLEILEMNRHIREMLMDNAFRADQLEDILSASYHTLGSRARGLLQAGTTSVQEVHRTLGYRFWMDIAAEENVEINLNLGETAGDGELSRACLMVVSADEEAINGVRPALSERYEVLVASSIEEADTTLRANRGIDLLILDVEHATASPREFLAKLRSAFDWSGLPALLVLPEGDTSIDKFLEDHGANFVAHKPLGVEGVMRRVQAILAL